jgi:hypothetical protein
VLFDLPFRDTKQDNAVMPGRAAPPLPMLTEGSTDQVDRVAATVDAPLVCRA